MFGLLCWAQQRLLQKVVPNYQDYLNKIACTVVPIIVEQQFDGEKCFKKFHLKAFLYLIRR